MDTTEKKKSRDFNIYYLNFSKVYEIAMMINNVILTKIETDKSSSFEEQYGFTSSISAQGTKQFLDGIKASISADARETSTSSSKVAESLDVKTTKSILLRRIIPASNEPSGRACTASWRMPRGSNTPLLCSVARLIPRCLQRGI